MWRILVLHGANLQTLGRREPAIYGTATLAQLNDSLVHHAAHIGVHVEARQSNHEGHLLDWLGAAHDDGFDGVIINAGAWAHTSLALADGVGGCRLPVVEVHLTNTHARGEIRSVALVGARCVGRVEGFGAGSYVAALHALRAYLDEVSKAP
jgi:3-dehydroquinate dehydratase II